MENYIEVEIAIETDGDFNLSFKSPKNCLYTISNYKINLKYDFEWWDEKTIKESLINFLKDVQMNTSKDYLKESFDEGKENLIKSINENLFEFHTDILGGGNWSFVLNAKRITTQYI